MARDLTPIGVNPAATRVLDIDLDFFVKGVAHWMPADGEFLLDA
jgi:hypothetical protein